MIGFFHRRSNGRGLQGNLNMVAAISDEIFLKWVENFITTWSYKATEFGRLAIGDPNLVAQLRGGRTIMLSTVERVLLFMEGGSAKHSPTARQAAAARAAAAPPAPRPAQRKRKVKAAPRKRRV